jgi:hypothetical protein
MNRPGATSAIQSFEDLIWINLLGRSAGTRAEFHREGRVARDRSRFIKRPTITELAMK